jgi:hypothetical protein
MDFNKFLQIWKFFGFLFDLELSNGFTNLMGGIASVTHLKKFGKNLKKKLEKFGKNLQI